MNRRTILKGSLVLAATSHTAVATAETSAPATVSIDEFLAKALPSERVRYHSNALVEAMAELHPDKAGWRVHTDHEHAFVLVVPRHKPGVLFQDTGREE